jgi:hypothetical protein
MKCLLYTSLSGMLCTTLINAAEPVPYGHPDFYPSPDRPLGWRGDGAGAWPGAEGITSWNAETPSTSSGQAGEGIVWKATLPGAGMAQPLVAGEKVFVTVDPNLLVCLNVHDGTSLWQTAIDHTAAMPPEQAAKAGTTPLIVNQFCRCAAAVRADTSAEVRPEETGDKVKKRGMVQPVCNEGYLFVFGSRMLKVKGDGTFQELWEGFDPRARIQHLLLALADP